MVKLEESKLWNRINELYGRPEKKWDSVDKLVYGLDDYYQAPSDYISENRNKAVKEAFKFHYDNNLFYHELCKDRETKPEDLNDESDFTDIPMVHDGFFKEYPSEDPKEVYEWLYTSSSVELGEYTFDGDSLQEFLGWAEDRLNGVVNHSSGTTGNFSLMFRDELTTRRMFYAIAKTLLSYPDDIDSDIQFVYPGPSQTYLTMGHWVQAGSRVIDDRHFLTDVPLTMEMARGISSDGDGAPSEDLIALQSEMKEKRKDLINLLEKKDEKNKQVLMVSFPFQLYDLMMIMDDMGKSFSLGDSNSYILTSGGWKVHQDKKISEEEFADMIHEYFGIPTQNYADFYALSEMNGVAADCEDRYKHLSPWIYPFVLDSENRPLGLGEWGRFAFLDPAANSYPGFIMTGDKVRMLESCPECDREGPVLESEISRMEKAEARGCGNFMRELMAKEFESS